MIKTKEREGVKFRWNSDGTKYEDSLQVVHPHGYNKFLVKKTQDLDGMNKSVNITGKE